MFERPLALWLLLALPLVVAPGFFAIRAGRRSAGAISSLLRIGAYVGLVLIVAGLRLPSVGAARRMTLVVAMDESRSISPDQHQWMLRQIAVLRRSMNMRDRLAVIGFGRDAQLLAAPVMPRLLTLGVATADPSATDIAGALTTAAGIFPPTDEKRLLLLSDGNETQNAARADVPELLDDGINVFTAVPPAPTTPRVALSSLAAADTVPAGTSFALRLDLESEARQPIDVRLQLLGDGVPVGFQTVTLKSGMNRLVLPYQIDHPGAYLLQAKIDAPSQVAVTNATAEVGVSVVPPPRVLLISGNPPESLTKALALRRFQVETAAPHGLPRRAEDYLAYQAVVVANVSSGALDPAVQHALNRYVGDYGGGLIVTGDTLRDAGFRGSDLEKTLPIKFEPQPPPPSREPIAVYLLIDRSNSMSYDSRYPAVRDYERIRYAKQAAIALLNQLDDTDLAGVIAFDSEPYILGHLRPLGEVREELTNRVRRLEPGGGTDFKEALEIAEREILNSGVQVREVILLTDGDTNRQYHDHDELMADYARHQIPVSTIRIGPDQENLRLLQDFARETGGVFYRVDDITKLPQLLVHLTHEAENFKRHENSEVTLGTPSSILSGIARQTIPPMDFFALTQARDDAEVPLYVRHGSGNAPLLATWQYQLGRSAVFVADPDSIGSLAWIRWNHYAEFWSQLIDWVARAGDSGVFDLAVKNSPAGALEITANKADGVPVNNLFARITGPGRAADVPMSQVGTTLYRGESLPLKRGKYSVALMLKAGDNERVLVTHAVAVAGAQAADSAEVRLRPPNLALLKRIALETRGGFNVPLDQLLKRKGAIVTTYNAAAPYLLPLVIFLILGEVFVRRRFLGD